jgi:tetratricopeptide (TPR) repeat protein
MSIMKKNLFEFLALLFIAFISTMELSAHETAVQQVQAKGDTIKAALAKAQSLAKQGNAAEASKICTDLMQSYPDNKEAVQGWLMINMKRSPTGEEEAIKQLEDLGKQYPNNTGILFFRMYLEAEHGHNEEALRDCEILIQKQPGIAVNYIAKGQVLSGLKKDNEALEALDKATALDPKLFDAWNVKAGILAKMGRYDEAIASVNNAVELMPNNSVCYYNRACMNCLKGNKANALADLKKAIDMNPSFKESARKDEDFKSLYNDEDFKKLTE